MTSNANEHATKQKRVYAKRENLISMYDLTIPYDKITIENFTTWCFRNCSRWAFQIEIGSETNYKHFQARISLKERKRPSHFIKIANKELPSAHVSPTSTPTCFRGDEFYVMKDETRVEGPWTDRTTVDMASIPERWRITPIWYAWQAKVIEINSQVPCDRIINVLFDPRGSRGKSVVTGYYQSRKLGHRIPAMKDSKEMIRAVFCLDTAPVYFFDIPKATKGSDSKIREMYCAIEEIKSGFVFEDRYKFTQKLIPRAHVWVFTNTIPDINLLSRDRWVFWMIDDKNELVQFTPPEPIVVKSRKELEYEKTLNAYLERDLERARAIAWGKSVSSRLKGNQENTNLVLEPIAICENKETPNESQQSAIKEYQKWIDSLPAGLKGNPVESESNPEK